MRKQSKRRSFQWVNSCACLVGQDAVTNNLLHTVEFPIQSHPDMLGGTTDFQGMTPLPLPDIRQYRVLLDLQLNNLSLGEPGSTDMPWGGDVCAWLSVGLLETEWDSTDVAPVVFDPSNDDDAEWYWQYRFPMLWNEKVQANPSADYAMAHPQTPLHFDLAFRSRRAGSKSTKKRQCTVWVFTLDTSCMPSPPNTARIDVGLYWRTLYSSPS